MIAAAGRAQRVSDVRIHIHTYIAIDSWTMDQWCSPSVAHGELWCVDEMDHRTPAPNHSTCPVRMKQAPVCRPAGRRRTPLTGTASTACDRNEND